MSNVQTKASYTFIGLLILILISLLVFSFFKAYEKPVEIIQGQIEAQQYSVSSKVPGRIDKILVNKGDKVERGDLVFTLRSPEILAKLQQAKAGERAAGAMAEQAHNGAREQELAAVKNQWLKAKAALALMAKTYKRVQNLYKEGIVTLQNRDEVYTKYQAAKLNERSAFQLYAMAKEGARSEIKLAAEEKENMAAGAVAEVEAYFAETKIESWHHGEVSQILLQPGELSPTGFPVVSLIDMEDAWAIFHIREDKLSKFQTGSTLKVKIPAIGNEMFTFRVSHVAVMGDFATWRSTDTAQGFDMRTFEVEARPIEHIESLRVGMSVLVEAIEE
ncbi:MAG: HlyD family secretion protein [Colwellia sp.]